MKEENGEYLEAVLQNDLVEIADAVGGCNIHTCRNYFNSWYSTHGVEP
jgi:hypothetical protein